jgi:hypothetical protein
MAQETHLAHRRESHEADGCNTSARNVKPDTAASASTTALGRDELAPEFGEFGFQLAKMITRRLVWMPAGQTTLVALMRNAYFSGLSSVRLNIERWVDSHILLA